MSQNYYDVLGIRQNAEKREIDNAYRRLARGLNPQVNPDPLAQARFREITRAYEVLGNADKRLAYDGPPPGGLSREFLNATAGQPASEKLHYAIEHRMANDANLLLRQNVVPAEKTLLLVVREKQPAWTAAFIKRGAKPTLEMLGIAMHNNDAATMNVLLRAGVRPDQKILADAVQNKWSGCVRAFIDMGAKATPGMLQTAEDNGDAKTAHILRTALPLPKLSSLLRQPIP